MDYMTNINKMDSFAYILFCITLYHFSQDEIIILDL